ncbi:MAG: hypothetical protein ACXWR0_18720 [Bdellovibrio sp.]
MYDRELDDFKTALEAPLFELFNWQGPALQNKAYSAYIQTLIGYFSSDFIRLIGSAKELKSHILKYDVKSADAILALRLNRIRRCILKRQFLRGQILCDRIEFDSLMTTPLGGEFLFLFARIQELQERSVEAARLYNEASRFYSANGCEKKSLRSHMNSLVCQGRDGNEDELTAEYCVLYKKSQTVRDKTVAATCCHNISLTLVNLGAFQSSLSWAHLALQHADKDTGSLNYFQYLLHRADIFIKMGRPLNARIDIEQALISEHPTVQGAAALLLKELNGETEFTGPSVLSPGWKRRESTSFTTPPLSELEDKMVGLLIGEGISRDELIGILWSEASTEKELLIDRFKQVLKRLRSKIKYTVQHNNATYFIDFKSKSNSRTMHG